MEDADMEASGHFPGGADNFTRPRSMCARPVRYGAASNNMSKPIPSHRGRFRPTAFAAASRWFPGIGNPSDFSLVYQPVFPVSEQM